MKAYKKDYIAIAENIKDRLHYAKESIEISQSASGKNHYQGMIEGIVKIAWDLADVFEADNERFDTQKFMRACGIPLSTDENLRV